jgi:hypothetical protein
MVSGADATGGTHIHYDWPPACQQEVVRSVLHLVAVRVEAEPEGLAERFYQVRREVGDYE